MLLNYCMYRIGFLNFAKESLVSKHLNKAFVFIFYCRTPPMKSHAISKFIGFTELCLQRKGCSMKEEN